VKNSAEITLDRIGIWLSAGRIDSTRKSILNQISKSLRSKEINSSLASFLLKNLGEVRVAVAGLCLANTYASMKRIAGGKEEIDTLLYGLDQLSETIAKSGDERLVFIHKMLSAYLEDKKNESQNASSDPVNEPNTNRTGVPGVSYDESEGNNAH
jgi:hypothetical protein